MKKITKLVALILAVVMCLSLVLVASAEGKDTVRVTLNVEPTSMHPGFSTSVVGMIMGLQMYDTLIVEKDGEYLPSLATEWSWNDEGTELTFTLRDDVVFHNGDRMTAEDVAFSYNTIRHTGYSEAICGFYDHMDVVDDNHVVLVCDAPYGAALMSVANSTLGIFSKAFYEADPDGFVRTACGTGPYKFVSWDSGASIKMEANEDYWGQKASIKNLEFVIYANAATSAALALENGEVDVMTTVSDTDISRLSMNNKVQLQTTSGSSIAFIMFSMEEGGLFQDENLRLAIAHAINKEDVLLGAAEGHGTVANTIFPDYSYGIADYVAPGYDPDLAQEYLEKAGYPDGLDIDIIANSTDNYYKPAEIVQAQLAEVGINLNIEKMEQNAWFEDVWRAGDYGMSVLLFSADPADVLYYYQMFTTNGNENFGHVSNAELDEAYDRAYTTTDLDARAQACYDVVKAFGDHAICVPIYILDRTIAASADLQGFKADHSGYVYANEWSWAE